MALRRCFRRSEGEGRIVEVGCWEGRSTIALARTAHPLTVHAVDTWMGSPGEPSEALAAERDVYATFLENVAQHTLGNVVAHRTDWRAYFAADRSPLRFLHIDAEHSYQAVRDNIEAALPLLEPGGVICGDDRHHEPVARAVIDVFGKYAFDASLWWWSRGL